jgi:phosphoglucosamine mutase
MTDAVAGISISASHNPFEDNGVKIFGHDGMKVPDSIEEEIETDLRLVQWSGVLTFWEPPNDSPELIERYERFLDDGVAPDALRGRKVVLDTGNGAAFRIGPEVFQRAGAEVVVINNQPNGRNINDGCGAMHPEAAKSWLGEGGFWCGLRWRRRPGHLRRRRWKNPRRRRDHLPLGAAP